MLELLENPYFLIPVISFFIAQLIKFALRVWRGQGEGGIKRFFGTGNMPSSHTALVTALLLTVAFESGLGSAEFGISFAFAAIVIYDALNVRRAVGEQGGMLMMLIERARMPKEQRDTIKIDEVFGHQPREVVAGASLATAITLILEHDKWWDWFYNGLSSISSFEINVFYAISGAAIVLGFIITAIFRRAHLRKLPTSKGIIRAVGRGLIGPGFAGLALTWLLQEDVARFDTAIWLFLLLVWSLGVLAHASVTTFSGALTNLASEKEHFSEEKKRARAARRKKPKKRR